MSGHDTMSLLRACTLDLVAASTLVVAVSCRAPKSDAGEERSPATTASQDLCARPNAAPPMVTAESIGVLRLDDPLSRLRQICPSASPTEFVSEETTTPALAFRLGQSRVLALQSGESLAYSRPAEAFLVTGPDARLPLGLTMSSTWNRLRSVYGPIEFWSTEDAIRVEFCQIPRMLFDLSVREPRDSAVSDLLSFIPDSATIRSVWVYRASFFTSACAAR